MATQPRRQFLQSSALALGALGTAGAARGQSAVGEAPAGDRQYYEWRTYVTENEDQKGRVIEHLTAAAKPAWKRQGVGPVGLFEETGDGATQAVHALLTFDTAEQAVTLRAALEGDAEYQAAAADYLATPKDEPAFARIESTLMLAFAGQPRLITPDQGPRVFELRTYHSHSEEKARLKVEMFNAGEIPVFRDVGFTTVFFGESLVGPGLPNLRYLLSAPSMEANQQGWRGFGGHPDWQALRSNEKYADTVSSIERSYLSPVMAASEV